MVASVASVYFFTPFRILRVTDAAARPLVKEGSFILVKKVKDPHTTHLKVNEVVLFQYPNEEEYNLKNFYSIDIIDKVIEENQEISIHKPSQPNFSVTIPTELIKYKYITCLVGC